MREGKVLSHTVWVQTSATSGSKFIYLWASFPHPPWKSGQCEFSPMRCRENVHSSPYSAWHRTGTQGS